VLVISLLLNRAMLVVSNSVTVHGAEAFAVGEAERRRVRAGTPIMMPAELIIAT
jgi:hypothetical protein